MESKIRDEIIDWISKTENEELLETLLLIKKTSVSDDWFDELSENEKKSVSRGITDQRAGKTLESEEFWATVDRNI